MSRVALAAAALMLAANTLSAQITTYIAPPRPPLPNPQMVASADSARRDSVHQAAITNMKAWVDSAAGVTVPSHVGAIDSTALANDPGRPDVIVGSPSRPVTTTTFSEGALAPATASNLPALAMLGALAVVLGAVLIATRPRG